MENEVMLRCPACGTEHWEDSWGRLDALVLVDERKQIPTALAAWCSEECLATWMGQWVAKLSAHELKRRLRNVPRQ